MTAAMSERPPADGWTTDDLEKFPEDDIHRELLDGVLLEFPTPSSIHQVIAMRLGVALEQTCPKHLFVSQANEVQLSRSRLFVPDVLVASFEAAERRGGKFDAGEVVLAVEIVSPSSETMDRVLKPALYAEAGIPHFWRIETQSGLTVHTYRLQPEDGTKVYRPSGTFKETIELTEPWLIRISVERLRPRNM